MLRDATHQCLHVVLVKRRLQRGHFVQRNANAVYVTRLRRLTLELLRRHITQRSAEVSGASQFLVVENLGESEIGDPHRILGVDQQVGRLDVTMQHAVAMRVVDGTGDLQSVLGDPAPIETFRSGTISTGVAISARYGGMRRQWATGHLATRLLRKHPIKPLSVNELHDVVVQAIIFTDAEDRDNVGVMEFRRGLCFTLESSQLSGRSDGIGRQDLQSNGATKRFLDGLVDDTHATAPDFADDSIVTDLLNQTLFDAQFVI